MIVCHSLTSSHFLPLLSRFTLHLSIEYLDAWISCLFSGGSRLEWLNATIDIDLDSHDAQPGSTGGFYKIIIRDYYCYTRGQRSTTSIPDKDDTLLYILNTHILLTAYSRTSSSASD